MEDCNNNKKRVRDDDSSELVTHRVDSPEYKIRRVESDSSESQLTRVDSSESQLIRVDSGSSGESCPDSVLDSEVELQDDIFDILDEADNVNERDSVQGLDSVIKSFEEEILAPGSGSGQAEPTVVSESGEIQSNLGYLLEASDDELGLPPTVTTEDEPGRVGPEGVDLTGFMGFEDDFSGYDAFGLGNTSVVAECDGGYVAVDGLFDYGEQATDVLWRSESLQAM